MHKIVIATIKSWNIKNAEKSRRDHEDWDVAILTDKSELTEAKLREYGPEYVFFPHWSWKIPKTIYANFNCVVFHMTDLPFGRGGSPLQNLLARGIYKTMVSAIKVEEDVDSGPVYWKEPVDISEGSAREIFTRVSEIIFSSMIPKILNENPIPQKQEGTPVVFQRRRAADSEIPRGLSQRQIYDHIRMLDAEGYPAAYINDGGRRIFFSNARYKDGVVAADATFGKGVDV